MVLNISYIETWLRTIAILFAMIQPLIWLNKIKIILYYFLQEENGDGEEKYLEIKVGEGTKVGEGMGAYVVYKVDTKTNLPSFRKNTFSVHRRFSDFLGLHDKLNDKYLRTGRIIPPAPEKSVIGMTKIKMSGQNEQRSSCEFIERRRASLERYLQRTAAHSVLANDPDFREFLQSGICVPYTT